MASEEIAEYLDDDGKPIKADGVSPPKGYSLLSSKKTSTPKKKLAELKAQADKLKPVIPPKGYINNTGVSVSAYTPSFLEQVRNSVANSAIGYSLEQAMPGVADALHLHPTEKRGTPQAEQHKDQLLSPQYLAPAITEAIRTGPLMQAPSPPEGRPSDATSNRIEGALTAAGGLTSGKSLATMGGIATAAGLTAGVVNPASAQLLSRLVSGGFTLDMLHSLYQEHKEYRKAIDAGDINEAQKIQGEMGVTGIMALLAGKHALTPHPMHVISEHPVTGDLHIGSQEGTTPTNPITQEPITAYHGTPAQFEGAPRTDGLGAHFTLSPELAKKFAEGSKGRVIEAKLGIKNPLRVEDHGGSHTDSGSTIAALVKQGHLPADEFDADVIAERQAARHQEMLEQAGVIDHNAPIGTPPSEEWKKANYAAWGKVNNDELERAKKYLKSKGYDGLVYDNKAEGHGDSYVAFDPEQISIKPEVTTSKNTPIPGEPQKPLHEMSPAEIEEEHEKAKNRDKQDVIDIFGEEDAKKYNRLQKASNNPYDMKRADHASAELQEMESKLTPEQQNKLYGIGDTRHTLEDLKDYRDAYHGLDDSSPEALGNSLKWAVSQVGDPTRSPETMTPKERVRLAQLRYGYEDAVKNGYDPMEVMKAAVKSAAGRFSDPNDARMMLQDVVKALHIDEPKQLQFTTGQDSGDDKVPTASGYRSIADTGSLGMVDLTPNDYAFISMISGGGENSNAVNMSREGAEELGNKLLDTAEVLPDGSEKNRINSIARHIFRALKDNGVAGVPILKIDPNRTLEQQRELEMHEAVVHGGQRAVSGNGMALELFPASVTDQIAKNTLTRKVWKVLQDHRYDSRDKPLMALETEAWGLSGKLNRIGALTEDEVDELMWEHLQAQTAHHGDKLNTVDPTGQKYVQALREAGERHESARANRVFYEPKQFGHGKGSGAQEEVPRPSGAPEGGGAEGDKGDPGASPEGMGR